MNALTVPLRRAFVDLTIGRGALAFWLCIPLVFAGFAIVRQSGIVAVEQVKVVGLDGYYDKAARRALVQDAQTMSTLGVDAGRLRETAGEFVDVRSVRTQTDFPHGLTVYVDVIRPVATAHIGGRTVALTATGAVLDAAKGMTMLPALSAPTVADGHVTADAALAQLVVLGGAPLPLLRQVKRVGHGARGITVTLDKGTQLYFGDTKVAAAKWAAAAAVLAGGKADGAKYIDLRIPSRPAVGGLGPAPLPVSEQGDTLPATPSQVQPTGAVGTTAATGATQ